MTNIITVDPDQPDKTALDEAARRLTPGSLIIYPTETFYGIGAAYDDEAGLENLFKVKEREVDKPVLLLISSLEDLSSITASVSNRTRTLAQQYWPGPLTIVFEAAPAVSRYITGTTGRVGCRVSSNIVAGELLRRIQKPITSTSANISGGKSPTCINDIPRELLAAVDIVVDAGKTPGGAPSTIIDTADSSVSVIREGVIPADEILKSF